MSTFFVKKGKGKGLDLGAEPPRINICWVSPPPFNPGRWGPQEIWGGDLLTIREVMVYDRLDILSIEQNFIAIKGAIFTKRNRAEEELITGYKNMICFPLF